MWYLHQPKCSCLQCRAYSFVYSSVFDVHQCLECELEINNKHVHNIVLAFGVYRREPMLIHNYNALNCLSCLVTGGIHFKKEVMSTVYCNLCKKEITIDSLHQMMTNAYRTKLIESSYNHVFTIGEKK